MIMSHPTEDERIRAFVVALALALQNIVGKAAESTGTNKRKPQKRKKADQGKTKRAEQKS